jgi:hypothetical protein
MLWRDIRFFLLLEQLRLFYENPFFWPWLFTKNINTFFLEYRTTFGKPSDLRNGARGALRHDASGGERN